MPEDASGNFYRTPEELAKLKRVEAEARQIIQSLPIEGLEDRLDSHILALEDGSDDSDIPEHGRLLVKSYLEDVRGFDADFYEPRDKQAALRWLQKNFPEEYPVKKREKIEIPEMSKEGIDLARDSRGKLLVSLNGTIFQTLKYYTLADVLKTGITDENHIKDLFRRYGVPYVPEKVKVRFYSQLTGEAEGVYEKSVIKIKIWGIARNPDYFQEILIHELSHYLQREAQWYDSGMGEVNTNIDKEAPDLVTNNKPPYDASYFGSDAEMASNMEEIRLLRRLGWTEDRIFQSFKERGLHDDFIRALMQNAESYIIGSSQSWLHKAANINTRKFA